MSQISDIRISISRKYMRDALSIEKRAELLCDIVSDLGYDEYDLINDNGNYLGHNIELAINDLKKSDKESISHNW